VKKKNEGTDAASSYLYTSTCLTSTLQPVLPLPFNLSELGGPTKSIKTSASIYTCIYIYIAIRVIEPTQSPSTKRWQHTGGNIEPLMVTFNICDKGRARK